MTSPTAPSAYVDEAVFQPGTGGVFISEVGHEPPTIAELTSWISGDRTLPIGDWTPIGYTSVEDLPALGTETEGGEKMGVWENADFRMTPVTTTDTVSVKPVQWSEIPLTHRFGAGTTVDRSKGTAYVRATYIPVEVAIMVLILDGDKPLAISYYRAASSPDGDLELDRESYAALPIKYTVLGVTGNPNKMAITAYHLQDTPVEDGGQG